MTTQIVNVPIENIIYNAYQVADTVDQAKVEEIKVSLVANRDNGSKGLLQITRARQLADGRYEQAFGRHRLIAFEQLAATDPFWSEMPLLVSEMTDIEMFELMGIENFHRRDISAIEEATIFNTYMTSFKKSSVEAAQKFGKTEEYVRGSIRLLNLPEKAQSWMMEGKITKSGGRDLLVALKVGGPQLVEKALVYIEDNTEETTADCVESVFRDAEDVYWLPAESEWAKVKKFPVKHLDPLTFKVLEEVLENSSNTNNEILKLIQSGMEVTDEAFPNLDPYALQRVRVLANPPQCEACPLHAVLDGASWCGLVLCAERKKTAWEKHKMEQVSKDLGIPFYQKSDGEAMQLNQYNDADQKLFKKGSPDLRLMPTMHQYNNFEGLGDKLKLVVVGETAKKRNKKEQAAMGEADKSVANRKLQDAIYAIEEEYLSRFSWEVAASEFASILDGVTSLGFLKDYFLDMDRFAEYPNTVLENSNDEDILVSRVEEMKKADAMKEFRRMIMFHAVDKNTPGGQHGEKKPIIKLANEHIALATKWELKLPKDFMTRAEKYQKQMDEALKSLEADND